MEIYTTSDIQIAALLLAEGVIFRHIDNTDLKRQVFVFEKEKRIDEIVTGFWRNDWLIAPGKYMRAYKELKHMLYHL